MNPFQDEFAALSNALIKLATAASDRLGGDCVVHATLAYAMLSRRGVPVTIAAGIAAWRVGPGDSDVIVHAPIKGVEYPEKALPFHVWLEVAEDEVPHVLDFTTYQFERKARELDQADGGSTRVLWTADYLYAPVAQSKPLNEVIQAPAEGEFFYERIAAVEAKLVPVCLDPDETDLAMLEMVLKNPQMKVMGPNDFPG